MIGRFIILLVLFCVLRANGLTTLEQHLLELEHVVKLQGDTLLQQRDALEQQKETFEQQCKTLEQQGETLEQQREELVLFKIENNLLKSQVKTLEKQVNDFVENQEVIIENTKTTTDAEMLLPNNGTIDDNDLTPISTDPDRRHTTLNKVRGLRATAGTNVAFYAYISGTPCLDNHGTIVFNTEVTDNGAGYNPTDGIYTVPVFGTYVFTWSTASRDDWYVSEFVINGVGIAYAYTDTALQNTVSQATGIVVIYVNQGDKVFVRKISGSGCNVHDEQYHLTSLAGWRLFG